MARTDLPAVQKAYDLAKEILTRTAKFPRDHKFLLGDRLANLSLDVLDSLIKAQYSRDKLRPLDAANLGLDRMRHLLRLANELGPLPTKGYAHVTGILAELGAQIGGWRKQAAHHGENV